jgi:hypothetical protein
MASPIETKRLEKRITEFSNAVAEAREGNTKLIQELLLHIHKPGWTTVADIAFVHTHLDSLQNQLKNINEQLSAFVKAARLVEMSKEKEGVLN